MQSLSLLFKSILNYTICSKCELQDDATCLSCGLACPLLLAVLRALGPKLDTDAKDYLTRSSYLEASVNVTNTYSC